MEEGRWVDSGDVRRRRMDRGDEGGRGGWIVVI